MPTICAKIAEISDWSRGKNPAFFMWIKSCLFAAFELFVCICLGKNVANVDKALHYSYFKNSFLIALLKSELLSTIDIKCNCSGFYAFLA